MIISKIWVRSRIFLMCIFLNKIFIFNLMKKIQKRREIHKEQTIYRYTRYLFKDNLCDHCEKEVGINQVWVKESSADPHWTDIPLQVAGWECSSWDTAGRPNNINFTDSDGRQDCWKEFAGEFNLRTADGTSVGNLTHSQVQKTIFFLPSIEYHEPRGTTGGENFGIMARIPVLVQ